jgi:hypothetical protein
VLFPVRRPVTTLDCIQLKDSSPVLAAELGAPDQLLSLSLSTDKHGTIVINGDVTAVTRHTASTAQHHKLKFSYATPQHFNEDLTDILNNCNFSNFSKVLMYAP